MSNDHRNIQGWSADLDPADRPAVPMERIPQRFSFPQGKVVPQKETVEILLSPEYPSMRPIFGTVTPPSGLSGIIRRAAFKRSENDIRHWLMLIFADRINVVEGILDDLRQGHIPNVFAEMGWKAKFKYDTAAAITKTAVLLGTIGLAGYLLLRDKGDED